MKKMQLMMVGNTHVQHLCIDGFTEDEIKDAQDILNDNISAFYRTDDIGWKLRDNAIEAWKRDLIKCGAYKISDFESFAQKAIIADLENEPEIKNAIVMNHEHPSNDDKRWH